MHDIICLHGLDIVLLLHYLASAYSNIKVVALRQEWYSLFNHITQSPIKL